MKKLKKEKEKKKRKRLKESKVQRKRRKKPNMKREKIPFEARYWERYDDAHIKCRLCPRSCIIGEGKSGFCFIRKNVKGKLVSFSFPSGFAVDPIEKKPLFHFLPGTRALSFGTLGCNLGCSFCQNWHISKSSRTDKLGRVEPEDIVQSATDNGCRTIAYTYNEPTIFFELVTETAKLAKKRGIKNVAVTNGFTEKEPLDEWSKFLDGVNVDMKSFDDKFYRKHALSFIDPVLDSMVSYKKNKVWIEITNLKIPGLNDSKEETREMCRWISENLGNQTPLHITSFYPAFKMRDIKATPKKTLMEARNLAKDEGLQNVYIGNVMISHENETRCPGCNALLISRGSMTVRKNRILKGRCPECKRKIEGVW